MTINSCEMALRPKYPFDSEYEYSYVIVLNGDDKIPDELELQMTYLATEKSVKVIRHPEALSPPAARQMGAAAAEGDLIFFLDNHVMVRDDYFDRAWAKMGDPNSGIDMLHSSFRFYSRTRTDYHYTLLLDHNFWARSEENPQSLKEPYRCAASGHGGFAVRRSVWEKLGGYWDGFVGYAGEELYWDLKMWQHGYEVWIDPQLIHYHFAGNRSYSRHFSDDYYRNLMMCASLIGEQKHVDRIYQNFRCSTKAGMTENTMYDLYVQASDRSLAHAKELRSTRVRDLDQQLAYFKEHNIPF